MSILICLTILLAWTSQCASLSLTPSIKILSRSGTSNFTLTCTIDDHPNSTTSDGGLGEVHRMRIVKRGKDRWNTMVEMSPEWNDPKVANDFQGKLTGKSGQTYLQATWSMASNETVGHYSCDVIGYSGNGESLSQRTPSVYIDIEAPLSLFQLFTMTQNSQRLNEKALRGITENKELIEKISATQNVSQSQLKNTKSALESVLDDMSLVKAIQSQTVKEQKTLSEMYHDNWPQGTYALIEPETGCPVDTGVEWKKGNITHHTESSEKNHDHVSTPAHMKKPIIERDDTKRNNFVTEHHCSVIESTPGRAWPSGSYCIMKYRNLNCSWGFNEGYINYDEEDSDRSASFSGYHAASKTGTETKISYCCRNDSLPSEPIHLPTRKPFYLHRYGGICQQVKGMNVTDEFIFFDTENHKSHSRFNSFAPDDATSLPDVKLQLCYYEAI